VAAIANSTQFRLTIMKMHSIQIKLKAYASRLFFKQVVYVDNDDFYNVNFKTDNTDLGKPPFWQKTTSATGKIAILGRDYYREQLQWYPITKKTDVVKLLRVQLVGAECPVVYVIGAAVNGKTPVTYYYLDKLPTSLTAWLLIPEALLLATKLNSGEILSYSNLRNSRTMFVAKAIGGVVSAYQSGVIKSPLQFALSQGLNLPPHLSTGEIRDTCILNGQQLGVVLLTQVTGIYELPLQGLINSSAIDYDSIMKRLTALALPAALVFSIYLLIANQLASLLVDTNLTELSKAKKEANSILVQRQNILDKKERFYLVSNYLPEKELDLVLWQVLAPLYESDVIFQVIQTTSNKVVLRMQAPSASKVLGLLIGQPNVEEAKFDTAVRRQSKVDLATISFTLIKNEAAE
jgi:hypothetical protein